MTLRAPLLLIGGQGLGQLAALLGLILLIRIFDPASIGQFGTIFSVATLLSVFFTLKIEQLIFQEDCAFDFEKNHRAVCAQLLFSTLTALGLLCLAFVFFGRSSEFRYLASASVLMALVIALQGVVQVQANFKAQWVKLGKVRLLVPALTVALQLLLSVLAGPSINALVFGAVISMVCGWLFLRSGNANLALADFKILLETVTENAVRLSAMIGTVLLSSAGLVAMPAVLALFFSPAEVGGFFVVQRLILGPTTMLAQVASEILRERLIHVTDPSARKLMWRHLLIALVCGAAGVVMAGFLIRAAAPLIFHGQSYVTSNVASYLTIAYGARMLATPLTVTFTYQKRQPESLIWSTLIASSAVLVTIFSAKASASLELTVAAYSATIALCYCCYGVRSISLFR